MNQRSQSNVRILELSRPVIQESQQSYCRARLEEGVESFEGVGVREFSVIIKASHALLFAFGIFLTLSLLTLAFA